MNKEGLKIRLDLIKQSIKSHKEQAKQELEKEEMIPLTSNIMMMRDLKEQQYIIENILKED